MNFEFFGVPRNLANLNAPILFKLGMLIAYSSQHSRLRPNHGLTLFIQSLSIRDRDETANVVKNKHTKFEQYRSILSLSHLGRTLNN